MKNTPLIFSQDQLQQIRYWIRRWEVPVKFAYLTEIWCRSWWELENHRAKSGEYSMDALLMKKSLDAYLEELGNPEEIQLIDIWGWYGHTAISIVNLLGEKWIGIHYHTIDISSTLMQYCRSIVSQVVTSSEWHLLDIDDWWVAQKIRTIKSKSPKIPLLITVFGNTIWNFDSPKDVVRQISYGLDASDRLIIWTHFFRKWYEEIIRKEYWLNENVNWMLSCTFKYLWWEWLITEVSWNPENSSVEWYIQTSQASELSVGEERIIIPSWYRAQVLKSKKFSLNNLHELAGWNRIAQLTTDTKWLYWQLMVAPNQVI